MNEFTIEPLPLSKVDRTVGTSLEIMLFVLDGLSDLGELRLARERAEREPLADAVQTMLAETVAHE